MFCDFVTRQDPEVAWAPFGGAPTRVKRVSPVAVSVSLLSDYF